MRPVLLREANATAAEEVRERWAKDAQRRIYTLRPESLVEVDDWLGSYRLLWQNRLDALHTEIARGRHQNDRADEEQR